MRSRYKVRSALPAELNHPDVFRAMNGISNPSDARLYVVESGGIPSEIIVVQSLDWDTRMLKRNSARIVDIVSIDRSSATLAIEAYEGLTAAFAQDGFEYVTARRPSGEWSRLHVMERAGFRLIDGIVNFERSVAPPSVSAKPMSFRLATSADAEAVVELAAEAFKRSRFHNDPVLNSEIADDVHREWARNSCLGFAADAVWLVEESGGLAGFVTCQLKPSCGVIGLIAVSSKLSGRGFGRGLVEKSCSWFGEKGLSSVQVQTQMDNLDAIRLYTKLGFGVHNTGFTLRWSAEEFGS